MRIINFMQLVKESTPADIEIDLGRLTRAATKLGLIVVPKGNREYDDVNPNHLITLVRAETTKASTWLGIFTPTKVKTYIGFATQPTVSYFGEVNLDKGVIVFKPYLNYSRANSFDEPQNILVELGYNPIIVNLPEMSPDEELVNKWMYNSFKSQGNANYWGAEDAAHAYSNLAETQKEMAYLIAHCLHNGMPLPGWLSNPHVETIGEVKIYERPEGYKVTTDFIYNDEGSNELRNIPSLFTNDLAEARQWAKQINELISQFKNGDAAAKSNMHLNSQTSVAFAVFNPPKR